MNIPRLLLAIVAGFVVVFGTDVLIHGFWLMPDYQATQSLWRPEAEMGPYRPWLFGVQFLTTFSFVMIWTRWADTARLSCAIGYGFLMGLFAGAWPIALYAVTPTPGSIVTKWFIAGIAQCILLGLVTFFVYKPKSPDASVS